LSGERELISRPAFAFTPAEWHQQGELTPTVFICLGRERVRGVIGEPPMCLVAGSIWPALGGGGRSCMQRTHIILCVYTFELLLVMYRVLYFSFGGGQKKKKKKRIELSLFFFFFVVGEIYTTHVDTSDEETARSSRQRLFHGPRKALEQKRPAAGVMMIIIKRWR
jgi:hypothetical protein